MSLANLHPMLRKCRITIAAILFFGFALTACLPVQATYVPHSPIQTPAPQSDSLQPSVANSLLGTCDPLVYACNFTTALSGSVRDHAWSPDGKTLALYQAFVLPRSSGVFTTTADGSRPAQLVSMTYVLELIWSPDSRKIAFTGLNLAWQQISSFDLYLYDMDKGELLRMTDNAYQPSWSPDGSKLAFMKYLPANNEPDIFTINVDGTQMTNLTKSPEGDYLPQWSPDGAKIAFHRSMSGDRAIFVMNTDGTQVTNVSHSLPVDMPGGRTPASDPRLAWAPDSSRIFFLGLSADSVNRPEIFRVDADGSNLVNLTNDDIEEYGLRISVDGTKLLYIGGDFATVEQTESASCTRFGQGRHIYEFYVMNLDGSDKIKFVNPADPCFIPNYDNWLPDGKRISFAENGAIYLVRVGE